MSTPMVIHFYGPNDEVQSTFSRSFVPWKLLKEAVKISKTLDQNDLTEENVNELAGLVVAVFSDQFTVEEVNNQADVAEMIAVLNQIVSTASGGLGNPTTPGKP